MDGMDNTHAPRANEPPPHAGMRHTSFSVSEILPDFLAYLRVEEQCTSDTLLRYQKHIQAFFMSVGDSPVGAINSEKLSAKADLQNPQPMLSKPYCHRSPWSPFKVALSLFAANLQV